MSDECRVPKPVAGVPRNLSPEVCGRDAVAEYRQPMKAGADAPFYVFPACGDHDTADTASRFRPDLPLERREIPDGDWTTVEHPPTDPTLQDPSGQEDDDGE